MFEPEVSWKQVYSTEESTCDIVVFLGRPHAVISRPHGDSATRGLFPFAPSITPLTHAFINCKAV